MRLFLRLATLGAVLIAMVVVPLVKHYWRQATNPCNDLISAQDFADVSGHVVEFEEASEDSYGCVASYAGRPNIRTLVELTVSRSGSGDPAAPQLQHLSTNDWSVVAPRPGGYVSVKLDDQWFTEDAARKVVELLNHRLERVDAYLAKPAPKD